MRYEQVGDVLESEARRAFAEGALGHARSAEDLERWLRYNVRSVPRRAMSVIGPALRRLSAHDLSGRNILDLGCGAGGIGFYFLTELGAERVVGIDRDEGALAVLLATKRAAGVRLFRPVRGDIQRLPLLARSFDVVVSVDNFYYSGLDRSRMIGSAHRVLCRGGILVIKTINGAFPIYALSACGAVRGLRMAGRLKLLAPFLSPNYSEAPRSWSLARMLRVAGFDGVEVVSDRVGARQSINRWFEPRVIVTARRTD